MTTRFFALVGTYGDEGIPTGLFRETRMANSYTTEYLSPDGSWVDDPSLMRFTMWGEMGAEEVDETRAEVIIGVLMSRSGSKEKVVSPFWTGEKWGDRYI